MMADDTTTPDSVKEESSNPAPSCCMMADDTTTPGSAKEEPSNPAPSCFMMADDTTTPGSVKEEPSNPAPSCVLCNMCQKAEAKYKCPRCMIRTCSLPCVLRHKQQQQCRGERNKTGFIAIKEFTDADLRSDLHFLEESARKTELAKKDRSKDQHFSFRRKTFISHAKQQGVHLLLMPNGMSKNRQNTSMYHFQSETVRWRVVWCFPQENLTFVSAGFSDTLPIQDGVDSHLQEYLQASSLPLQTLPSSLPPSQCHPSSVSLSGSTLQAPDCEEFTAHLSESLTPESRTPDRSAPQSQESADEVTGAAVPEPLQPPESEPSGSEPSEVKEELMESQGAVSEPATASDGVSSSAVVPDGVQDSPLRNYTAEGGRQYHVFLKVHGLGANKERYYELDKAASLRKNLQGKSVIEFPTLLIVPEQLVHTYQTLSEGEKDQLANASSSLPYNKRQPHRFRGNHRNNHRQRPRRQYKDADIYNPDSDIFKP